jgi:hypothetical protein
MPTIHLHENTTATPERSSTIDAIVVRDGKNLKGRMVGILLKTGGKRVLGGALAKTVTAIEPRNKRGEAGVDSLVTPAAGLLPRRIGLGRRQRGHEAAT